MKQAVGYTGLFVVVAGIASANPFIIGSGLSFLLWWQHLHIRSKRQERIVVLISPGGPR